MEALRRYSAGELSEIIGPSGVESDRESRVLRLSRLAEAHSRSLPPDDHKWAAAYARGVNHFIDTHRDNLPLEFTLLNFDPRPWTIADSVVIGLQMFRDLTTSWKGDLTRAAFLSGPNRQLAAELFPRVPASNSSPGRTPGSSAGSTLSAESRFLRTIPTFNGTSRLRGTWSTCRPPG